MQFPTDLLYTKDHEWVRFEGDEVLIGITEYAQQQMGDIVFAELPAVGDELAQGAILANIESVKAVSEVFAPVAGQVSAVNDQLESAPELLNTNPYGAWIARLRVSDVAQREGLLDAAAYQAQI